jgi:hypothetical protein
MRTELMLSDHEADELQALLRDEYGAPPLDERFSADLLARLQAEVAKSSQPSLTRANPRQFLLKICLAIAAVAALVLAVIWISQPGATPTSREVARREKTRADRSQHLDLDVLSDESKPGGVDHLSVSPRSLSLSPESESLPLRESLSESPASESKYSRLQRREGLAREERAPPTLSKSTQLSVLSTVQKEWPNVSAAAGLADLLYVVDSSQLYEVNTGDGSRRRVGEDDWQNTAAMGAAGEHLYIVCDNQLYEVNPKTGARRSLGKPDWANTKTILTVGAKLYIASNGFLHRVNPNGGSHEILHSTSDGSKNPPPSKP